MDSSTHCGKCEKFIPVKIRKICCSTCKAFFHVKCCNINHKSFENMANLGEIWNCAKCISKTKLASNLPKTKCGKCNRTIAKNKVIISCIKCSKFFHAKCSSITFNQF